VQTDDLERIVASDQFGLTDEKRRRSRRRRWRKSNYSTTKTWKQIVSFWFRDALWWKLSLSVGSRRAGMNNLFQFANFNSTRETTASIDI